MTDALDALDTIVAEARSAADRIGATAERALRDARMFLASPQGRNMRDNFARGLIAAAPAVAAMPILRRTWVGRMLGVAGAATAVVKIAEAIRDWEPVTTSRDAVPSGASGTSFRP